ncbi:hypothetical protein Y032_0005g2326 [Ancylostoma ceylanicum]|uniref:Uncharacterized protein n=1 Tax=Ancylostoma ceylanicum TaxID=53326 RepID=A0A016VS75_9BILA|nr:hypothetical protein Y032_0005g2326 [Ancylostoma ceylanicum]
MASTFSEDDRDYFNKFTSARKASHIDAGVLDDVHDVLSNKEFSSATRLAAAKLLVYAENIQCAETTAHCSTIDWIMLTALLESADEERTVKIFKIWMVCFEKRRIRLVLKIKFV